MMTTYFRFSDLVKQGRYRNRVTLLRHIKAGLFPAPYDLGPNTRGWSAEQLAAHDAALERKRAAKIAERDAPTAA